MTKKHKLKKHISIFFAMLIAVTSMSAFTAFAQATDDEATDFEYSYSIKRDSEEKLYSSTKPEDKFTEDEVIVMLTWEESVKFKDYTPDDFPGIGIKSVKTSENGTANSTAAKNGISNFCSNVVAELGLSNEFEQIIYNALIKNDLVGLSFANDIYNLVNTKTELGEQLNSIFNYHKVMLLTLDKKDKNNVLDVIKTLEQYDSVLLADANILYSIGDPQETKPDVSETKPVIETKPVATETKPATIDTPSSTSGNNGSSAKVTSQSSGSIPTGQNNFVALTAIVMLLSVCVIAILKTKLQNF